MQALENVRIVKAAAGKNHTLFLTSGGEVWVCGGNQFGQLGIGKVISSFSPAKSVSLAQMPCQLRVRARFKRWMYRKDEPPRLGPKTCQIVTEKPEKPGMPESYLFVLRRLWLRRAQNLKKNPCNWLR
jgi:hypothetical protein